MNKASICRAPPDAGGAESGGLPPRPDPAESRMQANGPLPLHPIAFNEIGQHLCALPGHFDQAAHAASSF